MEGNTAGNNGQRQLLMRCLVTNQQGESGRGQQDSDQNPGYQ